MVKSRPAFAVNAVEVEKGVGGSLYHTDYISPSATKWPSLCRVIVDDMLR